MLALTLLTVQRAQYNTVTTVPILIPCKGSEQQGWATFLGETGDKFQPVRAFTDEDMTPRSKNHPLGTMLDTERKFLAQIIALLRGIEKKDRLAITRARERLIEAIARKENVNVDPWILQIVSSSTPGRKPDEAKRIALEFATLGPRSGADVKWLLSTQVSEQQFRASRTLVVRFSIQACAVLRT